ncbi:MAG TPA: glycosyltransferase [Streptosporangiaceae bacterium]|nr:glycosyltransferase [Streptosporangiaceae bacterium]
MRIALVTPHATQPGCDRTDEAGPQVGPLAQALAQFGHEVTVYARADSPGLPTTLRLAPGVTVEHVHVGPRKRLATDDLGPHVAAFGSHLRARWQHGAPDIVHAYAWPGGLAAVTGAQDLGVPVAMTFHSLSDGGPRRVSSTREPVAWLRLKASLARAVDGVLARSSAEMTRLVGMGVPRSAIQVVPWGVDTGHFTPQAPAAGLDRRAGRRAAGEVRPWAAGDAQPCLLAGWPHSPRHGLEVVVQAMADLPGVRLVVAGGPQRSRLRHSVVYRGANALAAKVGVADRLAFTGAVDRAGLRAVLRSADLMVTGAWDELFDEMALQAMACGTPVVAPASGFYADAVIDGTTGLLVPPGRPGVLARRIRQALDSPMRIEAFGIAAADRASARFSWERIGRETVRAYQRLLPVAVAVSGHPGEDDDDLDGAEAAHPVGVPALAG